MKKRKCNKIDYKIKYEQLHKQFQKLETENVLLRSFSKPTPEQKIEILEEYYNWVTKEGDDANHIHTFIEYKNKLKRQVKQHEWFVCWWRF